jgi:hypothetical protein
VDSADFDDWNRIRNFSSYRHREARLKLKRMQPFLLVSSGLPECLEQAPRSENSPDFSAVGVPVFGGPHLR